MKNLKAKCGTGLTYKAQQKITLSAIVLFFLQAICFGAYAQNIGNSKAEILDKLVGKIEINKLQSGEEQIIFSEQKNSKIIGQYERTTIYWIGLNKTCNTISIIDPVSEFKDWCDILDSKYTRISSNTWKDKSSDKKISIRSQGDTMIMIIFTVVQ